jgi:hypothetical protein
MRNRPLPSPLENSVDPNRLKPCRGRPFGLQASCAEPLQSQQLIVLKYLRVSPLELFSGYADYPDPINFFAADLGF